MSDIRIRDEYWQFIKMIAEKNNISRNEVIDTALALFFKNYFLRFEMNRELQIVQQQIGYQEMDAEQVKQKIENDQAAVNTALAEAERLGLI